jgi:hypothetical protein
MELISSLLNLVKISSGYCSKEKVNRSLIYLSLDMFLKLLNTKIEGGGIDLITYHTTSAIPNQICFTAPSQLLVRLER